jgi:hypothetical protein
MSDIKEINVEEIMEEIRNNIAERNIDYEPISFEDVEVSTYFDAVELDNEIALAQSTWDVSKTYLPYTGNFIVKFIKKIVRRTLIIFSYRQNQFNSHVVRSLNQIDNYIKASADFKANTNSNELELKIKTLEKRIEVLEKEISKKD